MQKKGLKLCHKDGGSWEIGQEGMKSRVIGGLMRSQEACRAGAVLPARVPQGYSLG